MPADAAHAELVAARKRCRLCAEIGLTNPATVDEGRFDSEHIGPWSRWQGNLSAALMIVGQDWGDVRYFTRGLGGDLDHNPTNQTLIRLLASIGIEIEPPGARSGVQCVFLTNAILCLKQDGLQARVRSEWSSVVQAF